MAELYVTNLRVEEEGKPPVAAGDRPEQAPLFSSLWIVLIVIAAAVLLVVRWRRRSPGPVILNPKIGFLNLLGEEGERLLAEDRPALEPLFASVVESRDLPPPACDVLLVYCDLGRDGNILGSEMGLRRLLRRSRARILVMGSDNKSESCLAAAQEAGQSGANLILTMARNGAELPELLARLFSDMKSGTPMPAAYNRLAPRGKIFLADAGDLVFASG